MMASLRVRAVEQRARPHVVIEELGKNSNWQIQSRYDLRVARAWALTAPFLVPSGTQSTEERTTKEPPPNYRGKYLQLEFTVEDEGAFTTPWTATMTYGRSRGDWVESVCAENTKWYSGKEAAVPRADQPDF